jgi:photosystem II stability/assembly factor-like uncharacterized protein
VTSQFYIGAVSSKNPDLILAGAQDNYTSRSNGTVYWDPVFGGDGSFCAFNPNDDYIAYCSYQYLNIQRSDDQGFNWYSIFSHPASASGGNSVAFIAPFVLCHANNFVLYAGSDSLYRSDDGGFTWYPVSGEIDGGNPALAISVSHTNVDSLYVTTAPGDVLPMHVMRSIDGGATFTDISNGLPNRYPRDIAVNPQNSSEVFVVFSGFGQGHIFKSTDAGNNWTDVTGILPDLPFHAIEILPASPETLFVGCDVGVFASTDGGSSWYAFNMDLPQGVMVFDLRYSPSDNSLLAFTHGNGIYRVSLNDINTSVAQQDFTKDITVVLLSNPVQDLLSLQIHSGLSGEAIVGIFDAAGKNIFTSEKELAPGINNLEVRTEKLPDGMYFVSVAAGNAEHAFRFVKAQR